MQRNDFIGLFRAMDGLPVTIRTLDPPLHEFLPRREELMVEIARLEVTKPKSPKLKELRTLLNRVEQLHEVNPMLGLRGCRLGITYPEITEMQARAIFEAAVKVAKEGVKVKPEIMIPLTTGLKEMANQSALVRKVADEVFAEKEQTVEYLVGTMIELPRACLVADEIAKDAEFFSFGTNDLTQTTFGFSRDDVGKILTAYLAEGILKQDPVCRAGPRRCRSTGEDGHGQGPRHPSDHQDRDLRRTWRRAIIGGVLRDAGLQLRLVLAIPRADCKAGCGASGGQCRVEDRRWKNEIVASGQWPGISEGPVNAGPSLSQTKYCWLLPIEYEALMRPPLFWLMAES